MTIDPKLPTPEELIRKVPTDSVAPAELDTASLRDLEVEPVNFVPKEPLR